ncbi:MAG: hypothetical protein ABJK37_24480 [Paraglaciecola sp.]|uniref:hypothetical protein n=1 Tax=Paraglaciecola sp. TaxID=1920173 RepID=UPI003296F0ED
MTISENHMKTQNKMCLSLFLLLLANCNFAQGAQSAYSEKSDWLYYIYFDVAFGLGLWLCLRLLKALGNYSFPKRSKKTPMDSYYTSIKEITSQGDLKKLNQGA